MTVLYKIKLVAIPTSESTIVVELIPTSDPDLDSIRKRIIIETAAMERISKLSDIEQLIEYRREILLGNDGYQAEWAAQKVRKSLTISDVLLSRVGDEFPPTTEEELSELIPEPAAPEEPSSDDSEVIL